MSEKKKKGIFDKIWDVFASVKLAIIVFAAIGLTSIVGTIVEQQSDYSTNIQVLSKLVGAGLAPSVYSILDSMGFMDMYRSWWFISLLMLFSANLLICSLDRIPPVIRMVREKPKALRDEQFKVFPIKREFTLKGSLETNKEKVIAAIRSGGFKHVSESTEEGDWQAFASKGVYGRLGVYITHVSILVILLGAVAGVFFGFKGFLNLPEGSKYSVAFARKRIPDHLQAERNMLINALQNARADMNVAAQGLGVTPEHLVARLKDLGIEPLGFAVGCHDFEVQFYGNTDMPKEYTSLLSVTDGGQEVARKWIEVNDPLRYKGYVFYQSSYGMMDDVSDFIYIVKARSAQGAIQEESLKIGDSFKLADTGIEIKVSDFSPSLRMDASGRAFTYSELMNNPAIRLDITEGESKYSKWVLKRFPATWALSGGHSIQLSDVWGAQYTGLQVRRDPGVWIVYLGCFVMGLGLYMAFFVPHRRIWMRAVGSKGTTTVTVAASAHKGREGFERKVDEMIALLSEGGEK